MRIGEIGGDSVAAALQSVEQAPPSDNGESSAGAPGGATGVQMSVQVSLLRNAQEFSAKLMDQLLG